MEASRSSGSSLAISLWDTTACTAPETVKPSTSGHSISQPMAAAIPTALNAAASIAKPSSDPRVTPESSPTNPAARGRLRLSAPRADRENRIPKRRRKPYMKQESRTDP